MNDKPEVGRRTESGDIVACSPLVLSKGDFVDITSTIDIAYRGSSGVSVHFAFNRVVQLATASELPSVSTWYRFLLSVYLTIQCRSLFHCKLLHQPVVKLFGQDLLSNRLNSSSTLNVPLICRPIFI